VAHPSANSSFARLARLHHWDHQKHSDTWAVNFDPTQASLYFWSRLPSFMHPQVFGALCFTTLVVIQTALYLLWAKGFFDLMDHPTWEGSGRMLKYCIVLQLSYAMFFTVLSEGYQQRASSLKSVIARILRTTLLLLPFSFIPEWVIGCILWMFVPLKLSGAVRFFEHSLHIGPAIRYSLAYLGAAPGTLSENLSRISVIATDHRTRFFDITVDTSRRIMFAIGLVGCAWIACAKGGLFSVATVALWGRVVPIDLFRIYAFVGVLAAAMSYFALNAVGSIFALDFLATRNPKSTESALPASSGHEWLYFIPHAIYGFLAYALMIGLGLRMFKVL